MKYSVFPILLLCNFLLSAQSYEQVAVDFFSEKILPDLTKTKVLYDGNVKYIDSIYSDIAPLVASEFISCQLGRIKKDTVLSKANFQEWLEKYERINTMAIEPLRVSYIDLSTPKALKNRKRLKWKKTKSSRLLWPTKKILRSIFPMAYNMTVYSRVHFEDSFLVQIRITKLNLEYGTHFCIQLNQNKEIIDWCPTYWIQ